MFNTCQAGLGGIDGFKNAGIFFHIFKIDGGGKKFPLVGCYIALKAKNSLIGSKCVEMSIYANEIDLG